MIRFTYQTVLTLAAILLAHAPVFSDTTKRKVIIDDDGFSLMHLMLMGHPSSEVLGITSVTGNTWSNRVSAYALRGIELAGQPEIPVFTGALHPLLNTEAETERWELLYGKLTWKGVWMKEWVEETIQEAPPYYGPNDPIEIEWGLSKLSPSPEIAALFMIRMVRKYPGEVSIVAGGPLTNLALAQRLDPEFASLAKELVYMGASFNPRQVLQNQVAAEFAREFANSPRREFNIRLDPEAARITARAPWRKITIVPIDPSTGTQLTPSLIKRIAKEAPAELADALRTWPTGFPLWDEIAAGVWLDPSITINSESLYVDYNTTFGPSYGDTLSWSPGYEPKLGEQKATVILSVDAPRLETLITNSVANLKK